MSSNAGGVNQRFHIDLGSPKKIERIYYENGHAFGQDTNMGAKNFTLWGSNDASAFANTIYERDANWTPLTTATSSFDRHIAANQIDPKYILVTNVHFYRYYAFKIENNFGHPYCINIRRIELQSGNYAGAGRKGIILNDGISLTSGSVPYVTSNGRLTNNNRMTLAVS